MGSRLALSFLIYVGDLTATYIFVCVFVYGGLLQIPERKQNVTYIFVSVALTKKKK